MRASGWRVAYRVCVQSKQALEQLCYSARLLSPFVRLLNPEAAQAITGNGNGNGNNGHSNGQSHGLPNGHPNGHPNGAPAAGHPAFAVSDRDADARLPVGTVHEWLNAAIEKTRDPELGLKAGAMMTPGDAGVVDYVLSSAPTVAAAVDLTIRYMRLLNEAVDCRLEVDQHRAVLRLEPRIALPPAAEDFMLAGFYNAHAWLRAIPDLECWFMHAAPRRLNEYERVLGRTVCRFSAPCSAWAFSPVHLQQTLERADRNLHVIVRRLADSMLAELPNDSGQFSDRVRSLLARELSTPGLSTAWAARRLRMSVRTLARRLEVENTSFYSILDEVRHGRALRLIADERLALSEIAFVLGFAHVTSFHRAFRRWTGRTPAEYRTRLSAGEVSADA